MTKLVISVALLMNLLFVVVQCRPVEDPSESPSEDASESESPSKEAEKVANRTLQPGDTYTKDAEMFMPSGSGSGEPVDDGLEESVVTSPPIYCPPHFVEMFMQIFEFYPERCKKTEDTDTNTDIDN